jgi:hypothetical protein
MGLAVAAPPNRDAIRLNAAVRTYLCAYQRATVRALELDKWAPRAICRGPSRLQTTQDAAQRVSFCGLVR